VRLLIRMPLRREEVAFSFPLEAGRLLRPPRIPAFDRMHSGLVAGALNPVEDVYVGGSHADVAHIR
jgi:hypothetical protein